MKHYFGYIALFVVFLSILIAGWLCEKNEKETLNGLIAKINEDCSGYHLSDTYRKQELYYNGKELIQVVELFDTAALPELKKAANANRLVFLISESNCDMCVNMELSNLANRRKELQEHVILLIRANGRRYVSQFRINKKIEYPCFHVKHSESSIMDDPPMYFVLEKDSGRINAAFFPQKEKPEETERYLDKVLSDYFQDNE